MQNNSSTQKRQAGRLSYCQYHNNGAIYKEPYYQDLLLHPSSQHSNLQCINISERHYFRSGGRGRKCQSTSPMGKQLSSGHSQALILLLGVEKCTVAHKNNPCLVVKPAHKGYNGGFLMLNAFSIFAFF